MKRLFLELGGKSATIVLDDADFDFGCMMGMPLRARGPRLREPHPPAVAAVALRRGYRDPQGHLSGVSPWRSTGPGNAVRPGDLATQREPHSGYIDKGVAEGATLVGGRSEAPDGLDKGFFVKPTLFVDVDNSMTIAQEEIFGPVLCVIPFDDEDDAVRIANDSPYGLAGERHVGIDGTCVAIARRLRAGSSASTARRLRRRHTLRRIQGERHWTAKRHCRVSINTPRSSRLPSRPGQADPRANAYGGHGCDSATAKFVEAVPPACTTVAGD